MNPTILQPILGTSSKTAFSVSLNKETGQYHVLYGLELFEVVPADHDDMRFKLMIVHLYHVGVTKKQLNDTFGIDKRTIKRWSNAIKSGKAEIITKVFAGRRAGRKLTPEVTEYIKMRFPSIYSEDKYTYSRKMRAELKRVMKVDVSSEAIRPLLKELKAQYNAEYDTDDDPPNSWPNESTPPQENQDKVKSAFDSMPLNAETIDINRNQYELIQQPQWCSHLGLVMFSTYFLNLRNHLHDDEFGAAVCQWIGQVLLGALNIEQTKRINKQDLSYILGSDIMRSPPHQQARLNAAAQQPELISKLFQWNYQQLDGDLCIDLYYDPHTKHYTGKQNVLKGWCSSLHSVGKVLHGDFIHNAEGYPLYMENTDNFDDMRDRFPRLEQTYRQLFSIPQDRELTWIIDRGIYGARFFEWIIQSPSNHVITWEKDFKSDVCLANPTGSFCSTKYRNHRDDHRIYRFDWIDEPWPKNENIRRLIVQATNPDGKVVVVSVLCDDFDRDATEVIYIIFNRWIQENGFKYLITHYGINELTTYASTDYADLRDQLEDRCMKNGAYIALESQRSEIKKKLGELLLRHELSEEKSTIRQKRIDELSVLQVKSAKERSELGRLKGAQKTAKRHVMKREVEIEQQKTSLRKTERQLESTEREVSRIDKVISEGAVRLNAPKKCLMDVMKLIARNIFYLLFSGFKELYNNYRDDHEWFRQLTRSPGIIEPCGDKLNCHLICNGEVPKSARIAMELFTKNLNASELILSDGSAKEVELILSNRDDMVCYIDSA